MAIDRFEFASLKTRASMHRPSMYYLKFLLPITLILATAIYLFSHNGADVVPEYKTLYNVAATGNKERFVEAFMKNEIDGPYDLQPLKDFCASKDRKYQPGLVVKCFSPIGGFGNIKNMALNCLRFALEAGATGFVIPEITTRGEDITDLASGHYQPFDYLFDLQHFIRSFEAACPQVKLYLTQDQMIEAHPDINGIVPSIELMPQDLPDMVFHPMAESVIANIETWRPKFDDWLKRLQPPFSAEKPIAVTIMGAPLLRFPINYDPPAFVATYGRLILTRWDVRKVAAAVLFSLSERDNLNIDVTRPGIDRGKFYGVHLRTDIDALRVNWPGYDMQSKNYLEGGKKSGLKSMYVASGNPEDSARFRKSALKLGIKGAMKADLLERPGFDLENEQMKNMTWDQQGIVDYEVLLRCSDFSGVFESSFSWAISNRRHVVLHRGTWDMIYEGHTGATRPGPESFMDDFSTIYGPKDMLRLRWQFPLALWP